LHNIGQQNGRLGSSCDISVCSVDRGIEEIRFSVTGTKLFLKLRIVLWGGEDRVRVKERASCNRN
ncbi:MAG: hypothetical protein ACK55I_48720, partial [bacterium]